MSRKKKNNRFITLISLAILTSGLLFTFYIATNYLRHDTPNSFKALPDSFSSYGIDVSHYQGAIDWHRIFKNDSTISFVYCKATEGLSLIDNRWSDNREALKQLKIPHGAYHFFRPKISAKEQASHFLRHYEPQQSDLPPVLDAETNEVSNKELISSMKIWLNEIEKKTGKRPVIYTSYHMYSTFLKNAFEDYKFWVANYTYIPSRFKDKQIIHWQYTDQGIVNGIRGKVDINFSKVKF